MMAKALARRKCAAAARRSGTTIGQLCDWSQSESDIRDIRAAASDSESSESVPRGTLISFPGVRSVSVHDGNFKLKQQTLRKSRS